MTLNNAAVSIPRALFCIALGISWLVMLMYAWSAFSTLPTPERLEHSRMVSLPTLRTIGQLAARSIVELAVLTALAWPVRRRYPARLLLALVALTLWFFATAPLTLTTVEWVHRRWLAAVWLGFIIALAAAIASYAGRRLLSRERTGEQENG